MNFMVWKSKARTAKEAEVEEAIARQEEAVQKLADALNAARGVELRHMMEGLVPNRKGAKP